VSAGVLVVGAGLAGQRCCEALRARGFDGPIRMIGDERHRPYDRPPLSKELLAGSIAPQQVALRPDHWYADHDVELSLGTEATGLHPSTREVLLRGGARVAYERLVIATGGAPRALPALAGRDKVHVLRTLDDALALRCVLQPGLRLAVVGAGLIGLEVAATARALGIEVTVIEAAPAPLAAIVGSQIGGWLTQLHTAAGVEVLARAPIEAVLGGRSVRALTLATGRRVACDAILVAVGLEPRTRWLAGCDLAALPDVHVVGDAAGAGHWESAARDGAAAAAAILGVDAPPSGPPSFWSDQHGVRLQFAGTAVGHDRVEIDGDPAAADARAIFLRRGRPIGGLLLGRPRELPSLRRLLTDPYTERNAA
jgi:3-phenylpropionate/trans-cinnamate dioxygenase ferredoxin reductase component